MKRTVIAVLLVIVACYLALPARSAVDRNWALAGPGGQFGYVETHFWRAEHQNGAPLLIRSRTVYLGPTRFLLTETGARIAAAGFGLLGLFFWVRRGSGEANVKY